MSARRSLPPLALVAVCLAAIGCGSTGATTGDGATATGGIGKAAAATTTQGTAGETTAAAAPTTAATVAPRDRSTAAPARTTTTPAVTTTAPTTTTPSSRPPRTRASGRITVPSTEARATVTLRGSSLPCATVRRVVRTAYGRTVLVAAPRTTVRDAGRTFRCRYTASSGAMVCDAPGRRLRGAI